MLLYTTAGVNYLRPVGDIQIALCDSECRFKGPVPCDATVSELCCILMTENGRMMPPDADEALNLYHFLRNELNVGLVGIQ